MNIETAKSISLNALLNSLGYPPVRHNQNSDEIWYHSPFREERTPSFKVKFDRIWFDHGIDEGGTIIEFGMRYRRSDSVKEVLKWLSQYAYLANQQIQSKQREQVRKNSQIKITDVKPLSRRSLLHYLRHDRQIDLLVARHHLKEVDFAMNGKAYFAAGLANRTGGWELRNAFFKGCSSPKDISLVKSPYNPENRLSIFEGMMDFLSIMSQSNRKNLPNDVMVLNSIALQERAIEWMRLQSYQEVYTFFDNDQAGEKATKRFEQLDMKVIPQNYRYAEFKDVNDHHVHTQQLGYTR